MMKCLFQFCCVFLLILLISCKGKEPIDEIVEFREARTNFKNILILGNSITYHPPAPQIGWNGDWGMAASTIDKDFVHILIKRFKEKHADAIINFRNIADFESAYWNYDYSKLDSLRSLKPDLVILRIGENVKDTDLDTHNFEVQYLKLIDYFKEKNSLTKIICVSSFWNQPRTELAISNAGNERKLPIVVLSGLSADITNTASGNFANQGVASHPSDKGMEAIAGLIWAEVEK